MSGKPQDRSVSGRIRSIQYLRAVAALAVVAYHASERVHDELPQVVSQYAYLGHGGVDLFFVISGFIMWSIGCAAPRDPGRFLLKRAIRVVPMYWIATLCWVALVTALGVGWITVTPGHVIQSLLFIPHWSPTFSHTFWPVLVPGWTLLFEMFFYALFALTLLWVPAWRLRMLCAVLLSLVVLGLLVQSPSALFQAYTSPLLLEFLAGCLIAELWRRGTFGHLPGVVLILAGCVVLVALTPFATPDQTSWSRPLTFGLGGALIVWGAVCLEAHLPDMPLLERLGDASYAIYLFHLFVVQGMAEVVLRLELVNNGFAALGFIVLSLLLSSLLGLRLFVLLERPMQRWMTRMTARPASAVTAEGQ